MSPTSVPKLLVFRIRTFAISLAIVLASLAGFLFGVELDAVVPATGVITARDQQEVRALLPGLVEPGWYEGKISLPEVEPLPARMDTFGNGTTNPAGAKAYAIRNSELSDQGQRYSVSEVRFHRVRAGDVLWPGQVVATIRADDLRSQLSTIEDELHQLESQGKTNLILRRQGDRLRDRLTDAILRVPDSFKAWLVLNVSVAPFQAVRPGDVIASIVPVDPHTHQPLDLVARLEVDEKHFSDVTPGQDVRIHSTMYNHRLRGSARGVIEQLEPTGEPTASGEQRFHAQAPITAAPFDLRIGSTLKAEVLVGRKRVYRLVLEH